MNSPDVALAATHVPPFLLVTLAESLLAIKYAIHLTQWCDPCKSAPGKARRHLAATWAQVWGYSQHHVL